MFSANNNLMPGGNLFQLMNGMGTGAPATNYNTAGSFFDTLFPIMQAGTFNPMTGTLGGSGLFNGGMGNNNLLSGIGTTLNNNLNSILGNNLQNALGMVPYGAGAGYMAYSQDPLMMSLLNGGGLADPYGYGQQSAFSASPLSGLSGAQNLKSTIKKMKDKAPDYVPIDVPGGPTAMLSLFANAKGEQLTKGKATLKNNTKVDEAQLNAASIKETGGKYNQGTAANPFDKDTFLTDSNPYEKFESGILVTNGNGNGAVKGTQAQDILLGADGKANVIDGKGGGDVILGGDKNDLINIHAGDQVNAGKGDDVLMFDFSKEDFGDTTLISGGEGKNKLVLTVDGDPSKPENQPEFTRLPDGSINVSLNGKNLIVERVDQFLITDKEGNIGAVMDTVTPSNVSEMQKLLDSIRMPEADPREAAMMQQIRAMMGFLDPVSSQRTAANGANSQVSTENPNQQLIDEKKLLLTNLEPESPQAQALQAQIRALGG
jgi:hypothetical protein